MGEQFDKAVSLKEIVRAARECKNGVAYKDGPTEFCSGCLGYSAKLRREILSGRYHARPGVRVQIWRPKRREAEAPWFRDRVWQRSMCNNGVYEDLTRGFIPENMACQKGKGTDLAIRTVIGMLQELHREAPGATVWGRHLDIRKYFPSTPQEEIVRLDRERITDPKFLPYLEEIVNLHADPRSEDEIRADGHGRRGTGLGSQINQLNQIALLDRLDHELKEFCRFYIRYNDDFLILDHNRETTLRAAQLIETRLRELGLTMQDKAGSFRAQDGFTFLRKKFILKESGKIILRLHRRAMAEERQTLRNLKKLVDDGERTMADVQRHYQSWIANAEYAGDGPIREMDRFYTETFRQRPEYKRKRRYLYGNHCDGEGKNRTAGAGKSAAAEREQKAAGNSGIYRGVQLPGDIGRGGERP